MIDKLKKMGQECSAKVAGIATAASLAITNRAIALANPFSNAEGQINSVVTNLTSSLRALITPVATVIIIICGFGWMLSSDQRKVETYRKWIFTVVIAIILIYAADPLIKLAQQIGQSFSA